MTWPGPTVSGIGSGSGPARQTQADRARTARTPIVYVRCIVLSPQLDATPLLLTEGREHGYASSQPGIWLAGVHQPCTCPEI